MAELELSHTAQQWFNIVLVWIGFGTVAGLLARALLPAREPTSAVVIVTLGVVGSVVGPLALSYVFGRQTLTPLSPLGLLSAAGGAFVLLVVYRLMVCPLLRGEDSDP